MKKDACLIKKFEIYKIQMKSDINSLMTVIS